MSKLARDAIHAASQKSDIMWIGDVRFVVDFWSNPESVLFGIHGAEMMLDISDFT